MHFIFYCFYLGRPTTYCICKNITTYPSKHIKKTLSRQHSSATHKRDMAWVNSSQTNNQTDMKTISALTVWTSMQCVRKRAPHSRSWSCTGQCASWTEQWHPRGCCAGNTACRSGRKQKMECNVRYTPLVFFPFLKEFIATSFRRPNRQDMQLCVETLTFLCCMYTIYIYHKDALYFGAYLMVGFSANVILCMWNILYIKCQTPQHVWENTESWAGND